MITEGEPGVPLIGWAGAERAAAMMATANIGYGTMDLLGFILAPLGCFIVMSPWLPTLVEGGFRRPVEPEMAK